MVLVEHPLAVGEGSGVQGGGLVESSRLLVGVGEVVPRRQGVGLVRAEQPLAIGEGAREQGDRLV
jgi:hypothetical protein